MLIPSVRRCLVAQNLFHCEHGKTTYRGPGLTTIGKIGSSYFCGPCLAAEPFLLSGLQELVHEIV